MLRILSIETSTAVLSVALSEDRTVVSERVCTEARQQAALTAPLVKEVLDPLREKYGKPIRVNSGYRCKHHNLEVGGAVGSQHMKGEAADVAPAALVSGFKIQDELAKMVAIIKENGKWDQMIIYPTFVHVSWKRYGPNRKQVLRKITNGYAKV